LNFVTLVTSQFKVILPSPKLYLIINYIYTVNEVLRRTGIVFLLALYGLSISVIGFAGSHYDRSTPTYGVEDTIKDVISTILTDHSHQLDQRIVSSKEKSESGAFNDLLFWQRLFLNFLPFHSFQLKETIIQKGKVPLQFAQSDIIFPFHNFF
jgi:hypothetical protein